MSDDNLHACHPIIYVRGYAMTDGEKDDTAADPFCGFNLGSTVYRAVADRRKPAQRFYFESPVVRLMSEFGYRHVYGDGLDLADDASEGGLATRSIIIYRYYDDTAPLLGGDEPATIERFARGLSALILRIRRKVCANPDNGLAEKDFRCYLVAHSMGGLVCRAFLQNPDYGDATARACVDKLFTYATPHNGIEVAGINVPKWLTAKDMNTFNRETLAAALKLEPQFKKEGRVDWILRDSVLPVERMFCMVGSNRTDYDAAAGMSRMFAGHGSDGLVKIENASVTGLDPVTGEKTPVATAYAYRAHSGAFGIVNSEESYQNLTRFLFGDLRIDIWAEVDEVTLPVAIADKPVEALYQFEVLASPRGKPWYLTRRTAEEDSVACRSHAELGVPANPERRKVYLSTVFLANRARVNKSRPSLAYSMTFGVRVPDYAIDGRLWLKEHYEGAFLFRDTIIVELVPPGDSNKDWTVNYGWQSETPSQAANVLDPHELADGRVEFRVEFDSQHRPGVRGRLRFVATPWNAQ